MPAVRGASCTAAAGFVSGAGPALSLMSAAAGTLQLATKSSEVHISFCESCAAQSAETVCHRQIRTIAC